MKKLLITTLIIIVLIFSFNKYQDYKRFNGPKTNYKISTEIDYNYHDKVILYNYQNAISLLDGFVNTQWSAHNIDIINPKEDTKKVQLAMNTYAQKLAEIKHYEKILLQSTQLKAKGLSNNEIQLFEKTGLTEKEYATQQKKKKYAQLIRNSYNGEAIRPGQKSALIFEVQKLLIKHGFAIKNDGVYQTETALAIKAFETKHNLLPDGKLDSISLEYLLENN